MDGRNREDRISVAEVFVIVVEPVGLATAAERANSAAVAARGQWTVAVKVVLAAVREVVAVPFKALIAAAARRAARASAAAPAGQAAEAVAHELAEAAAQELEVAAVAEGGEDK